ncbi:Major facilitator sugar transporter-like [Trinorchestia longiramus]|nr:Major facilitator sugar transporter-like [Trinorchestia longiramus]
MGEESEVLDDVLAKVGYGKWTLLYFTVSVLAAMMEVTNVMIGEFTAPPLEFTCSASSSNNSSNFEYQSECTTLKILSHEGVQRAQCEHFIFNTSVYYTTLTSDFELVCDRSWYRSSYQMLLTLGCVVGALSGGAFNDVLGRHKSLTYGALLMTIFTLVEAAAPAVWIVLTARFFLGISIHLVLNPAITLGMEVCPPKLRTLYGSVESVPYALSMSLLAVLAYFCRHWRLLHIIASVPLFLLLLLSHPKFMDESPLWLLNKRRIADAERIIRRGARLNNTDKNLPVDLKVILMQIAPEADEPSEPLKTKLWSLVSHPEMRLVSVVVMVLWFCEGVLYLTLPLQTHSYQSPFLYMALLGLLEVPASFVVVPLGDKFGRIKVSVTSALVTSCLLFAMAFLKFFSSDRENLELSLAVIAYMSLVGVSQMLRLLTSELFPTSVRGLGTSLGLFMANLAYNVPPVMTALVPTSYAWVPLALNCALSIVSAVLLYLLPETLHRPLLQTVLQHVSYERHNRLDRYMRVTNSLGV